MNTMPADLYTEGTPGKHGNVQDTTKRTNEKKLNASGMSTEGTCEKRREREGEITPSGRQGEGKARIERR